MIEWITRLVTEVGYVGVAFLMILENVFPPIPSELIMPMAGFAAARGDLSIAGVVLAGALGSLAGILPWYWAGRALGHERLKRLADQHGRWLTMSADEIDRAAAWFERHGPKAVLIGRLVPGVRSLISVPAGVAGMRLLPFVAWSAAGTFAWSAILALAGYWLESRYEEVAAVVDPIAKIVLALVVVTYLYRLVSYQRPQRSE